MFCRGKRRDEDEEYQVLLVDDPDETVIPCSVCRGLTGTILVATTRQTLRSMSARLCILLGAQMLEYAVSQKWSLTHSFPPILFGMEHVPSAEAHFQAPHRAISSGPSLLVPFFGNLQQQLLVTASLISTCLRSGKHCRRDTTPRWRQLVGWKPRLPSRPFGAASSQRTTAMCAALTPNL